MTTFADKVVWISGASSGIGAAFAVEAARRGGRVALSARRAEALDAVRRRCPEPERHRVVPLDVADPDQVTAAAERIRAELGPIDIVVANAGVTQRSRVADTSLAVYRRLLEVDFLGVVAMVGAVLPSMLERGRGHVVGVTSVAGHVPTPLRSGYAAAKAAVAAYLDALRAEVADAGVAVTEIAPGFIRTGISLRALTGSGEEHGRMEPGQERGLAPERCAAAMADAIEAERARVFIGGREVMGVYLKRWFPGIVDRLLRRISVV